MILYVVMEELAFPIIVTLGTVALVFFLTLKVGLARKEYKVKVPKVSGNIEFEKVFRAQQNTLENVVMFLPLLWISSVFFSAMISGVVGSMWLFSRVLFALGYSSKNMKRRSLPFLMSILCLAILFVLSIVGLFVTL